MMIERYGIEQPQQGTIGDILESETNLVLLAEQRYGACYTHARSATIFLSKFVRSVERTHWICAGFLAQLKNYHTLALFSTVRRHRVQAMMMTRQLLESGAMAAFAVAHPDPSDYVDVDEFGIVDSPKKKTSKIYAWLDANFGAGSKQIKGRKDGVNEHFAHCSILHSHNLLAVDDKQNWMHSPFFDIEDEHSIKVDLWLLGGVAISVADTVYGVNESISPVKPLGFMDGFVEELERLHRENTALQSELQSTPVHRRASALAEVREKAKSGEAAHHSKQNDKSSRF